MMPFQMTTCSMTFWPKQMFCFVFLFFFLSSFSLFWCDLVYSIVLFPRIEPVGEPYSEVCFHPELWFGMVSQPNSLSKRLERWIEHVLDYCRDGKKYVGCIVLFLKLASCNLQILKTKKEKTKLGCWWDLNPGPLELQSNALPTELRGLWLQVNSKKCI